MLPILLQATRRPHRVRTAQSEATRIGCGRAHASVGGPCPHFPCDSNPVTNDPKPASRGAAAGALSLAVLLLCSGIGYGIGTLVGAALPLGLVGFFAGVVAGFAVVISRFRDL